MVAGHHPDNFVPIAMAVLRYKIELWWLLFNQRAEGDQAELESDVTPDKKPVSKIEYNSFFRDLSEFVIENPPTKQIVSKDNYDSAGEEEAIDDDDYKSLSISDANRLYWFAWNVSAVEANGCGYGG